MTIDMYQEFDIKNQRYYGYVYLTLDQKNNKIYIGQKKGLVTDSPNYLGSGIIIKNKIKSRGAYFFKKIILGVCSSEEELTLCETECKLFFKATDPLYGYNIAIKDKVPMLGKKHTDNAKKKMRVNYLRNPNHGMMGKKHSDESKLKISINRSGIPLTRDHKKIISEANKNKNVSKSTREKMSASARGNKAFLGKNHSEKTKKRMSINNARNGKSTYDLWVDKYGQQIANCKYIDQSQKMSITRKNKNRR